MPNEKPASKINKMIVKIQTCLIHCGILPLAVAKQEKGTWGKRTADAYATAIRKSNLVRKVSHRNLEEIAKHQPGYLSKDIKDALEQLVDEYQATQEQDAVDGDVVVDGDVGIPTTDEQGTDTPEPEIEKGQEDQESTSDESTTADSGEGSNEEQSETSDQENDSSDIGNGGETPPTGDTDEEGPETEEEDKEEAPKEVKPKSTKKKRK